MRLASTDGAGWVVENVELSHPSVRDELITTAEQMRRLARSYAVIISAQRSF
jgi:hypothetical protein